MKKKKLLRLQKKHFFYHSCNFEIFYFLFFIFLFFFFAGFEIFNQVLHKNLLSDYYNILIILIKNQQQQQQQKTEQEKFTT